MCLTMTGAGRLETGVYISSDGSTMVYVDGVLQ